MRSRNKRGFQAAFLTIFLGSREKKCLKKGQKDMTDFLQLSFYILSTSYMTTYQAKITEGVALNISKTYVCVLKKEAEH